MYKRLLHLIPYVVVLGFAVQTSLAAGLKPEILWWTFDEGSGTVVYDSSGNGRDGVFEGSPTWVPGIIGGALSFSGGGERVVDDDAGDYLNGLDAVTVAIWIKSNEINSDRGFIIGEEPDGGDNLLEMRYDAAGATAGGTNVLKMAVVAPNDEQQLESSENLQTTEWQHVVMTWSRNEQLQFYVDGQLDTPTANGAARDVSTADITMLIVGQGGKDAGRSWNGLVDDLQIYSRVLSLEEVQAAMLGLAPAELAADPMPADEATDVPRDMVLSWVPGKTAATHDVYLGANFEDVNAASRSNPLDVLVSEGQADAGYEPPAVLEYGQTYYWRIDEVNAAPDNTIFKGEVWSFTVEPFAYAIQGIIATSNASADAGAEPERTVDGSGLNENDEHSAESADMWLALGAGLDSVYIQYEFDRLYKLHQALVWNYNVMFEPVLGFGLKDVTVEYSADGVDWMVLGDVEFTQATAAPGYVANTTIDFGGVAARFVRFTVNTNFGALPQYGLSEVRFLQIAATAREPQPADGSVDVTPDAALSWRAGRGAAVHDVYFGTDPDALTQVDTATESAYDPGPLDFGTTYAWRIDEVNEAEAIPVWAGDLWSFATQEYAVIDDMESYDDEENRIFDTWLDGFVNDTGATVGYFDAPFAEQTIVNSGGQSMPLEYANDAAPFYSEAERDLGSLDIDTNGADTLRLFVAGQAPAFAETADGTILMSAIGADIWNTADEFRYAHMTLTGDGSITARVDAVDASPNGWVKGGVMIRQGTEGGSVNAFTAVTGGSGDGATFQWRDAADGASSSSRTLTGIAPPYYVRLVREGNSFTGYLSADGENWEQQGESSVDVAMTDPVLIGLALTSHNAAQATSAAFSDISTTGNVTGQWTVADIGVAQPETGNDIEPLYVALEDTSGNVAVVTHPNPAAAGIGAWQEWLIPYSDLAGINLSRIAIMYIGVGDRNNPTAGGSGTIFIDDIGFGRPATAQ